MTTDLVVSQSIVRAPVPSIDDISRVAKAYAMSGYWPDARDVAQAFVKVQFGYEVGLPAYIAMSEVHIIQGKPTLGAGALAALVKAHPRYDYRVGEHNKERCALEFFEDGKSVGVSEFTMEDAKDAGLMSNPTYKKYPRNMLFARAISNGVAFYCPDVTMGRVYTPDEMGGEAFTGSITEEVDVDERWAEERLALERDGVIEASPVESVSPVEEASPTSHTGEVDEGVAPPDPGAAPDLSRGNEGAPDPRIASAAAESRPAPESGTARTGRSAEPTPPPAPRSDFQAPGDLATDLQRKKLDVLYGKLTDNDEQLKRQFCEAAGGDGTERWAEVRDRLTKGRASALIDHLEKNVAGQT